MKPIVSFGPIVIEVIILLLTFTLSANGQTIIAGNGSMGCNNTSGVPGTSIPLDAAKGVAMDDVGRVIFTENNCGLVKRIETNGLVTIMADMPGQNFQHVDHWGNETRAVTTNGDLYIITENSNGTFNVTGGGNLGNNIQEYEYTTGYNWTLRNGSLYKNGVLFGGAGVVNDISTTTAPGGIHQILYTTTQNAVGFFECNINGCGGGATLGFLNVPIEISSSPDGTQYQVLQQDGSIMALDFNTGDWNNVGYVSGTVTDFDLNDNGDIAVSKLLFVCKGCHGQTTVTSEDCSLINGITLHQIISGCADTAFFSYDLNGDTITISSSSCNPIQINKPVTIYGNGIDNTILSGNGVKRLFHVTNTGSLTLESLSIVEGYNLTNGGAILNEGTLILKNVRFRNNFEGANRKAMTNLNNLIIGPGTTIIQE